MVVRTDQGEVRGSHVLVAVGRQPNTDDLGLDLAGVETDRRGFITVDERLQTTVDGWAVPIHPTVGELVPTLISDLKQA